MKKISLVVLSLVVLGSSVVYGQPIVDNFDAGLGSQWNYVNLGNGPAQDGPPTEGNAEVVDGQLLITNNGWDQWEASDGIGFLYQEVSGDFDVAVHLVSFDPDVNNGWEKGGIAFRQSLDDDAAYVSSLASRSNGLRGQYRLEAGGGTDRGTSPDVTEGYWTRLVREGDTFQILASESLDGPWIKATEPADRALPDDTLVITDPGYLGICYCPHSTDATGDTSGTCVFDDFIIVEGTASHASHWELFQ